MENSRLEKYRSFIGNLPFALSIDLKRTPYNLSKEQNWHENIEIQLCTCGSGTGLIDGREYAFEKDDILVVNSNVFHYTSTKTSLVYTCLIISTEWCKQMNIDYDVLTFSAHIKNSNLVSMIKKLMQIYVDYENPLRIAKSNELLLGIMIELIENHSQNRKCLYHQTGNNFEIIKSTIIYINQNFDKKLTLEEISKAMCYNKFSLCKEFKHYTGKTIFQYLHHYRCIKAIDYLSKNFTIAETASSCGFENLSFFTKIFKKYIGTTPSHYKKNHL